MASLIHNDTAGDPFENVKKNWRHSSLSETFAAIQTLFIILLFDHNYTNYGPSITSVVNKQGREGNENVEA